MSKALFIFSYNDVSSIDEFLDRIHKLNSILPLFDKLKIIDKYCCWNMMKLD